MSSHSALRLDIQALRAFAVASVVMGHVWPYRLTGGYVGVDVFFVISGFLITSHLAKELDERGRIDLPAFYARRVRRLLPAALLVLAASMLLVWAFLPVSAWERNAQEVTGAALFAENWILAHNAVDYSASQANATVAQHYWSLSVEEQFYLLWPLFIWGLVAGAAFLHKRRGGMLRPRSETWINTNRGLYAAAGLGILITLPLSQFWVESTPQAAYFLTPGRLWEFAVGALVAALARAAARTRPVRVGAPLQGAVSLAGWGVLAAVSFLYSEETDFPGYAAVLPVAATALLILAGSV
ncbi:acyltransferase [Falsarthrobacter nasiphocae]|uniref:Peptidoglycan/LPS O-acetylase OafA/YrhL n=1 Tax=Falsarthrobacter nasiphocae TaxID=189863 RepID=A0AAE3YFU4_9MICC|nr:acyltransferase [Falsarthrobacter nasiphocae]MDR6891410.1 peptidoglycan/LPS O-acetylase OafA/YrhL [Falsarthrobacter nasiphocae]